MRGRAASPRPRCAQRRGRCQTAASSVALFALFLALFSTVGCRKPEVTDGRPLVVASFFPLYDFARVLAGTNFQIVCLVPPGGDPHAMEASPSAARTVERAHLVLLLGLGMDGWLEKLAAGEQESGRASFLDLMDKGRVDIVQVDLTR